MNSAHSNQADLPDRVAHLHEIGARRRSVRLEGFQCIGDFHEGVYETEFVSPWTKSAQNPAAKIMIVAQDWASADFLSGPFDRQLISLGYDPSLPTNHNLQALLRRHFNAEFKDVFATNIFPYVKPGTMAGVIPARAVAYCAQEFLLPQIQIVKPRVAICLGLTTYNGLLRSVGQQTFARLQDAIRRPVTVAETTVHCVAHTGALGTNQRGRDQVDRDWAIMGQEHLTPLAVYNWI